jgi:putative protein kinase ArgK-like GTPase of G3E family
LKHQGRIEEDYKLMQKLAAAKYSGAPCITRLFVVGHPGAGKSSVVEALKRETKIASPGWQHERSSTKGLYGREGMQLP